MHPVAANYAARVRLAKLFGWGAWEAFDKLSQADLLAIYTVVDVDNRLARGE